MRIFSNSQHCRPPSISFTSAAVLVHETCANEKAHELFTAVIAAPSGNTRKPAFQFLITCRFGYCLETTSCQQCLEKYINSHKEGRSRGCWRNISCRALMSWYKTGKISKTARTIIPFKVSITERCSSNFHLTSVVQAFNLETRLFNLVYDLLGF